MEKNKLKAAPFLQVKGVGKSFPGVRALDEVDLNLRQGEVLAVIGENGAGKSTLMKILAGVQPPDQGEIWIAGERVAEVSVEAALEQGVVLIHQELNLASNLTVGANIFLGREPGRWGVIDAKKIRSESRKFLKCIGLDVDPDKLVGDMPIGQQQMVEIAKALSVNARVLIMDEPTSSLSQTETKNLFAVIKELRCQGVGIIYISHRLGEVKELADRVTVLRDGENAGELSKQEIGHDAMVKLMVGREVAQLYERTQGELGEVALSVKGLRTQAHPEHDLSFELRAGEIIGVAGLVGAGRTEMVEALFGVHPPLAGEIRVQGGAPLELNSPRDAIAAGMALVPEDRKSQGLILDMSVRENMSLASLSRDKKAGGILNQKAEIRISQTMIDQMRIKTPDDEQVVRFLSGGNQQKVVVGKWLAMQPKVLLLDEPTRGIDIGAKQEIYALMEDLAGKGVAVLFVSSEMEEILGVADRVLVMHEGEISGELAKSQLDEEAVMHLATKVAV
ncbi:MAG: sugar ABC transporter ATP-binding protein [Verrucomicrobiota bacterium]